MPLTPAGDGTPDLAELWREQVKRRENEDDEDN